MKILVTGGAGFIGSHLVDSYIEKKHEVVVIDNLYYGNINNINKKAKFYLMDIRSNLIEEILKIEKPDIVNHHASQVSLIESINNPCFDCDVNIIGLLNILQNCVKNNVKKIIFSSSGGAIYEGAVKYPTPENYSPNPSSPYGISKLTCENYISFYNKKYGINFTILRYSNVYGPRQIPHGEAGVIPIFINKLLKNEIPVIYAYPDQPDGMIRDYVYIEDITRANIYSLEKGNNNVINISSCKETPTKEIYNKICKALDKKINPEIKLPVYNETKFSCIKNLKAKKLLNWEPKIDLDEGIMNTCNFFKGTSKNLL